MRAGRHRRAAPLLAAAVLVGAWGIPIAGSAAAAQTVGQVFDRANTAAAQGDHPRAIRGYERLLEAGVDDPDVHFNLATSYARHGELGRAILHFERVLARRPGDEGAERGLAQARELLGQRRADRGEDSAVDAGPPFPEVLVQDVSEQSLAWALLALDVLLFGLLVARRWVRPEGARLTLTVAAPIVGLVLLLVASGLAIRTGVFRDGKPGIVLDEEAVLREGPDPRARARGAPVEGERVRILGRHGRFVRVRLRGEREGWMHGAHVEPI